MGAQPILEPRVHSHLRFIRHELLLEPFSPHNPFLNFSVHAKVDQISNVTVSTDYSATHHLENSTRNSSRLSIAGVNGPLPMYS